MAGRKNNNNKVVKVISIVLSAYMALSPVVVYADELSESESVLATQVEVSDETAASVEQAAETTVEDTATLVESEINRIENEAVREVVESIVDVDMTNVDDALNKVEEIVDEAITDEVVASEIEATADSLIAIYDAQATVALNALTAISENENVNAITVSKDGTVSIDWNVATEDVAGLYNVYQAALEAKKEAEDVKVQAAAEKNDLSAKVDKLNDETANKNREAITDSKQDKSDAIDELIASLAESRSKDLKEEFAVSGNADGNDIYKFFINIVEDGIAYGCLTYYDSANKIILRKNFKIASDGIDYNYEPKAEWVKENASCVTETFGNGGNYIAAYVGNSTSSYIDSKNEFKGKNVSTLMRNNVNLNNAIDARNEALNNLAEINNFLVKAEDDLQKASENAEAALIKYNEVVAIYEKAAELENEIKKDEVEKAKLEYVKAEVEAWRRQQALNQVMEVINNADVAENNDLYNAEVQESVEAVVNVIADNLGVEAASVEELVVQTIIETEANYSGTTNNVEDAAVAGVRRNVNEVEDTENADFANKEESTEQVIDKPNEGQKIVTIEDNEVALANVGIASDNIMNIWFLIIIALACVDGMLYVVFKKNQNKEEVEAIG